MMLKAAESRVCRYETTWAIARPPSELSSGMNGDPVCATPCTASYSAPRTTRAESRNAWAPHWRDGGQPEPPPALLAPRRAREVANWVKKLPYNALQVAPPWGSGWRPRVA